MNEKLSKFKEYIRGKSVTLIGAGISNMACVDLLLSFGASVTVCDKSPCPTFTPDGEGGRVVSVAEALDGKRVVTRFGDDYLSGLSTDLILKTPAVRPDLPEIESAVRKGAVLSSEIELFCGLCPCRIYAVTGSDGKTTTTTLIYKMLAEEYSGSGRGVYVGGNIGTPLLPEIEHINENDAVVLELSSFQLMTMKFVPHSAVLTNISPNHLNWHKDMEEYVKSKANIFAFQDGDCRTVFNAGSEYTNDFIRRARGEVTLFSSREKPHGRCVFLRGDDIVFFDGERDKTVLSRGDIRLCGLHNVENYMAAIAATRGEVSDESVKKVAREFCGVRHRLEEVCVRGGVRFINSSIDTTPSRTVAALRAFDGKVILIIGGSDKNIPPEPMIPVILEKAKRVCATGATGEKLRDLLLRAGYPREKLFYNCSFDSAVKTACAFAVDGDTVLLSPAAASFDSFRNFEVRGDRFCELVKSF